MLHIKEYDIIMAMNGEERMEAWPEIDNASLYRAYADSKERGLEVLDVRNVIFAGDAEPMVKAMREHGIRRFTISSEQDGLQNALADFCDCGCAIDGMTVVPSGEWTFVYGSNKSVPVLLDAIKMQVQ